MASSVQAVIDALPIESFEHLPDSMLCCICQQLSTDNVSLCTQSHNACRSCANRLLDSGAPFSRKCPQGCRDLHRPNSVWMRNLPLNSIVADTSVHCSNVKHGCTHVGKLIEIQTHIDVCEHAQCACEVPGCTWNGRKNEREAHMRDVDHGRYFINMLIQFKTELTATAAPVEALTTEVRAQNVRMEAMQTQLNCIGNGQNNQFATLQAIEGKVKWKDGSSARSMRRDRADGKKIKDLEEQASSSTTSHAEEVGALQMELENERKKPRRDEATEARLNRIVHEQHDILSRMIPHAAPRVCPCDACKGCGRA